MFKRHLKDESVDLVYLGPPFKSATRIRRPAAIRPPLASYLLKKIGRRRGIFQSWP